MAKRNEQNVLEILEEKDMGKDTMTICECCEFLETMIGDDKNILDCIDYIERKAKSMYNKLVQNKDEINRLKCENSFDWIPFTFDDEGVLNCELPDIGERILVSDAECMYDDESIWIDSWDSPDCGIYELESGNELDGLAWMRLPQPNNKK